MNAVLRCSPDITTVPALARRHPLALTPFLGATVLEHALSALAAEGVKHVRIEATDRVDELRHITGRGEAWGLEIQFSDDAPDPLPPARIVELDRLPQLPNQPLWRTYRDWYSAQLALLPAMANRRVGMREMAPGVFVGLRTRVDPSATLLGPCWIGANISIGSRAVVGPGTVIEDGSYIDSSAEVSGSIVGPQTYVGAFTEVRNSFAWGRDLLNLDTGSLTEVSDRFLLAGLQRRPGAWGGIGEAVRILFRGLPSRQGITNAIQLPGRNVTIKSAPGNSPAT